MFYLQDLRVRLQERRNRLYRTDHRSYPEELQYFLRFLDENPYIHSLLTVLEENSSVNFEEWEEEIEGWGQRPAFPETEEGRAKICHKILRRCNTAQTPGDWRKWLRTFSVENRYDDQVRDLTESVVDPFVYFLHDRIDDAGNVLFVIGRYKLHLEWFRRDELYPLYKNNTSVGEAKLDQHLRAALFEGGVDYPFSQPYSPSGEADVVALLGSNDPLVLEVKVFDPEMGRNNSHLTQGFHQVLRYANDYNQNIGYLVIFNCSGQQLVIGAGESPDQDFPPRINFGGKTFFVITIDVHPDIPSASRERPGTRRVISHEQLVGNSNDD